MRVTRRELAGATIAAATAMAAPLPEEGIVVNPRLYSFVGGATGPWTVTLIKAVKGESLAAAAKLDVVHGPVPAQPPGAHWVLRGVVSNTRYTTGSEKELLIAKQAVLGRPECTLGALIPIRKNQAWWDLTQDERRRIFEDTSHHVQTGLKYLPEVARRLHHSRDLSDAEPFDFLTLFDYAPKHAQAFEDLVGALRATAEWKFVDREVDIRLTR